MNNTPPGVKIPIKILHKELKNGILSRKLNHQSREKKTEFMEGKTEYVDHFFNCYSWSPE